MPRSPSRDLSDRYLGKRGYFRRLDGVRWWKYALSVLAAFGALLWAVADVWQPARANYAHTHGPLAGPHAAFDDNCAACHNAQTPDLNPFAVFGARDRWHDLSCGKCHAGPKDDNFAHHESATQEAREFHNRCSNCHHDHLGRLNSLVRHPDADCNQCHRDLGKWHNAEKSLTKKKGEQPYQNKITGFAIDHPEFRSLDIEKAPRTLKFSHTLHMNPGLGMGLDLTQLGSQFGPATATRYARKGQIEKDLVALECASCHTLDSGVGTPGFDALTKSLEASGESTRTLLVPRAEGAYFQPVNYDVSCRACHPLQAPTGTSPAGDDKRIIPHFDVAHRKQPAELRADLKAGYLKGMIATGNPLVATPLAPGGMADPRPPSATTLEQEAERLAKFAEAKLFAPPPPGLAVPGNTAPGCLKCHDTMSHAAGQTHVLRVPDRTVWLEHAKFNHSAHRGTTCATCHPGTETDPKFNPKAALVEKEPVKDNILGLKACQTCHAPAGTKITLPDGSKGTLPDGTKGVLPDGTKVVGGGVRHNCTDCHRYHHGDLPMQSRGAAARFPKEPRELADWLKGK